MLSKIQCLTPDGNGGQTRTHLVLSMHTMRGARGNYLASAIRDKWAQGCDFRVQLRADRLQDQADPRRLDCPRPDPAAVHRARLRPR